MLQRAIDVVAASLALAVLSPLLLVIAVAVKLTSAGPVFHRARRVGKDGRLFTLLKFRSMRVGEAGGRITKNGDPRITRLGAVLRKTKTDELPQLINVARGDMSLVGPRPEDPYYVAYYTPAERAVLNVRPGITSPASIEYRDEQQLLAGDDWERFYVETIMREKLSIDLDYIARRTVLSDLAVVWNTLLAIFRR